MISKICHYKLPPRASLFCWKFLNHVVPMDTQIQLSGINLASYCIYHSNSHDIEDEDHLFVKSDIDNFLWRRFAPLLSEACLDDVSINSRLKTVINEAIINKPKGFISLMTAIMIV